MKKILLTVVMLAAGVFTTNLKAQANEPAKMKVIIHENVNGQEKTIEADELTPEMKQKLQDMGVDVSELEKSKGNGKLILKTDIDTDNGNAKTSKVIVKTGDANDPELKKLLDENNVQVFTKDGDTKVIVEGKEMRGDGKTPGEKKIVKIIVKAIDLSDASSVECKKAGISESKEKLKIEDMNCTPNPSNGKFNLRFTSSDKSAAEIVIRDINGKVVYTESVKDFSGSYDKEIALENNSKGFYFVTITQGSKATTKKMLVE